MIMLEPLIISLSIMSLSISSCSMNKKYRTVIIYYRNTDLNFVYLFALAISHARILFKKDN